LQGVFGIRDSLAFERALQVRILHLHFLPCLFPLQVEPGEDHRDNCQDRVVDEPLYGHFLRVTGTEHPGREEVLATVDCDGDRVMRELLTPAPDAPAVLFMKQMAHHLVDVDTAFLRDTDNIFLIRDPAQMLPSLTIQLPQATLADAGLKTQWKLYDSLVNAGQNPAVVDARELLLDPAGVLQQLCAHLEIPWLEEMLGWPAGPRTEDGVWAKHWYHAVHRSSGFAPYRHKDSFPPHLEPLLAECAPWYQKLFNHALRASACASEQQ